MGRKIVIDNQSDCPDSTAMRIAALAVDASLEFVRSHGLIVEKKALKTQDVYTVRNEDED